MKKIFLAIAFFQFLILAAQKPAGFFGKQNTIGFSAGLAPFTPYRFGKSSIVMPSVQYTRVINNKRSLVFEYSRFNVKVIGNKGYEDMGPYLIVKAPWSFGYQYDYNVVMQGTATIAGKALNIYTVRNWKYIGQLGGYHAWGMHLGTLTYKDDNYSYAYMSRGYKTRDTFFNNPARPSRVTLAVSLSLGSKFAVGKSTRLIFDYGTRLRIPLLGYPSPDGRFDDNKEYILFTAVRTYSINSFFVLYAGLHYAF